VSARRTATLAALAIVGFAANSLLCRAALGARAIDAAGFTAIRLASGAVVLWALARRPRGGGSWASAAALAAYAVAFSIAYLRLPAGIGALVLFACVQATMIGWGVKKGERPGAAEWGGLAVAAAGLVVLARPGRAAPDAAGVALMAVAGVAWGVYSLRGRGATRPLATTADNFARTLPAAAGLAAVAAATHGAPSARGAALAVASGALASGVGYSLWYAALPGLRAAQAAIVQLAAPALAAAGGVAILGEPPTVRLVAGGGAVLGGVALAVWSRRR
jgi:drug/metabolite transporter (DMT)-like permease